MPWADGELIRRVRVISDNDYAGDPDGLVQLAHHALSPTVDLRAVIGSHLPQQYDPSGEHGTAEESASIARRILAGAGRPDVPVFAGAPTGLSEGERPRVGPAARAIIDEAMRDDTQTPLVVACGGGLTAIATAWLQEPRIAERLVLLWNGGLEYDDLVASPFPTHPLAPKGETNTMIDRRAAQIVFGESDLRIWQVPRDVYATATVSRAELELHLAGSGPFGAELFDLLGGAPDRMAAYGLGLGEVICLGDSPLVLLTALTAGWSGAPESSPSIERVRRHIEDDGTYGEPVADGRTVRIFTALDTRLLVQDLFAKFALLGRAMQSGVD